MIEESTAQEYTYGAHSSEVGYSLSTLHALFHFTPAAACGADSIVIFIAQIRKLWLEEAEELPE